MEHHQPEPLQPEPVQRIRCSPAAPGKVGRIPGYSANLLHRDAPRRNHCRQCRPKARAAAHNAPPPWPFSFAPPSRLPGLPDQQPGTRWVLSAAAPGKSWKVPGERWTRYPDIAPTTCTGKDRHRQRRADDPAAHKLHSLHTLPDLTAASSPPPAPTDTAPRQPCRPPAAADHPANSQKPPTAARRRRGQILYLTGIWPLQYSQ